MSDKHKAVRWTGKMIEGGSPLWIRIASRKIPGESGAVVRVRDTVHVFDQDGKVQVAKAGDWILHRDRDGEILVRTDEVMRTRWEFRDRGFRERPEEIVPRAGTEQRLEEGLRVLAGWTTVTAASHPRLHRAFEIISHDRGSGAGHETYSVPPRWSSRLDTMDVALIALSDEELETFCIGEVREQEAIRDAPRGERARGLRRGTHDMLNAFFDDWEEE